MASQIVVTSKDCKNYISYISQATYTDTIPLSVPQNTIPKQCLLFLFAASLVILPPMTCDHIASLWPYHLPVTISPSCDHITSLWPYHLPLTISPPCDHITSLCDHITSLCDHITSLRQYHLPPSFLPHLTFSQWPFSHPLQHLDGDTFWSCKHHFAQISWKPLQKKGNKSLLVRAQDHQTSPCL